MPIWPLCVSTPSGGREPRPRGRLAAPYGSRGAPAHLASRLGQAARSRSHPCLVGLATTTPAARQTITLDPQNENPSTPAVVLGVWSRDEVVRVDLERGWVSGPGVTDGLERGSPSQRFQVLGAVVGRHERENVS